MKTLLFAAASALALAAVSAPAEAQMNMPGMHMPMPAKPTAKEKSAAKKKTTAKRPAVQKAASKHKPAPLAAHAAKAKPAMQGMIMPMGHGGTQTPSSPMPMNMPMGQSQGQSGGMQMPMPQGSAPSGMPPMDHSQMQRGQMTMPMGEHGGHMMNMTGAFGSYPMERESSGTAWQPDTTQHMGLMKMYGDWTLMAHGNLNLVYDHQSGPRGDNKVFPSGMLMGMARRPLGNGTLQFKAMVSPDPIMGPSGYPLLLASGETADGTNRLIDRQHPHDLFMELSGSMSQNIGKNGSVFVYAGLPGEPAFGPPAFMHREAIMDSPEAPISHHWLDSTHITFGVLTAGLVVDRVKVEVSRFNAREPDQHRWDIETGPLDSTSARISWNPARTLSLQGSWGYFKDPEQLEPGVNQRRWSASALWADDIASGWHAAATIAWGRKTGQGRSEDAFALEASVKHANWTAFARSEQTENSELFTGIERGPSYRVRKASLGVVNDVAFAKHLLFGIGGLVSINAVPDALAPLYGGHHPLGAMGLVRVKVR